MRIYTEKELNEIKSEIDLEKYQRMEYGGKFKNEIIDPQLADIIAFSKKLEPIAKNDILLAKKLFEYSYFQNLTNKEANDERVWVTMTHEYFREYSYARWIKGKELTPSVLNQRLFKAGKMMYNRNAVARLWWITSQTMDETLDNPYKYTEMLFSNTQFDQSIMESTVSKNKVILCNLLKAICKVSAEVKEISGADIKLIMPQVNKVGGTYILDTLDADYFEELIIDVLEKNDRLSSKKKFGFKIPGSKTE